MAFVEQAQVNDIGTIFRATIYDTTSTGSNVIADISDASILKFIFRKPDGTTFERSANFTNDGTDGLIEYTTVNGDLSQAGSWMLQAYVQTTSGKWRTNTVCFKVQENL